MGTASTDFALHLRCLCLSCDLCVPDVAEAIPSPVPVVPAPGPAPIERALALQDAVFDDWRY